MAKIYIFPRESHVNRQDDELRLRLLSAAANLRLQLHQVQTLLGISGTWEFHRKCHF